MNKTKKAKYMKKFVLMTVALFATIVASAQNIAVVDANNVTTIYQNLDEAIEKATSGSTIYLPGGGFKIKDETKIDKKLTILGVSHRTDTDNADGAAMIAGNINYIEGADGSSLMGVYVYGNINVGDIVRNLTFRLCNINAIYVGNSESSGMYVNQCYLRSKSVFGGTNVRIENNVIHSLTSINGGTINHNVFFGGFRPGTYGGGWWFSVFQVNNTLFTNNFLTDGGVMESSLVTQRNCNYGDDAYALPEGMTWSDVFVNPNGANINSNYQLKGTFGKGEATDGTDIGIYGGSGFSDDAVAPIPRIVSKTVSEQTDGSGKLKVSIVVKSK